MGSTGKKSVLYELGKVDGCWDAGLIIRHQRASAFPAGERDVDPWDSILEVAAGVDRHLSRVRAIG